MTVYEVLRFYVADIRDLVALGQRKPTTLRCYEVHLRQSFAAIAGIHAAALTVAHVRAWHRALAHDKAASDRSSTGVSMANGALALLRSALKEAEALGIIERGSSPARYVKALTEESRTRYLTAGELRRLWAALDREDGRRRRLGRAVTPVEALRLIVLTGQRHREISTMRWAEVDLENAVVRLARSKTGSKEIALSAPAVRLLSRQHKRSGGGEWVFPSARKAGPATLEYAWARVRDDAGLTDGRVCIHTLRHSLATLEYLDGEDVEKIADALGHARTQTTKEIYCRPLATKGARAVMERHAARIGA